MVVVGHGGVFSGATGQNVQLIGTDEEPTKLRLVCGHCLSDAGHHCRMHRVYRLLRAPIDNGQASQAGQTRRHGFDKRLLCLRYQAFEKLDTIATLARRSIDERRARGEKPESCTQQFRFNATSEARQDAADFVDSTRRYQTNELAALEQANQGAYAVLPRCLSF
jgi:hypothetical protein